MKVQTASSLVRTPLPVPAPSLLPQAPNGPLDTHEPPHDEPPPNTREVRIARFVKGVTRDSLEHLRYLSTIYAYNMVGTTVGLVAFTPLGIKLASSSGSAAIVGGVAIGGGVLTGGIAALIGYGVEKKRGGLKRDMDSKPGGLADGSLTVAAGLRSLPKFIYPTVYGATEAQKAVIYQALDRLPLKDVTASSVMTVIPNLTNTGISGMSQPGLTHTRIILDQDYLNSAERGIDLVTHEQGHAVDYSGGYGLLGPLNWRGPFGKGPFVSEYASGNRYEDWAESFEHYHADPVGFKARFPEKAAIIEQAEIKTPSEGLMDRPGIRSAGRKIGDALGTVPFARTALEVGLALLAPIQLHRGARTLEAGLVQNDDAKKLQGKMNLISGILLAIPGGAPMAVAASAVHIALQKSAGSDPQKLRDANGVADRFMAAATGPLGMAAVAINQELIKAGVDVDKAPFSPGEFEQPISKVNMLKGLICTVGGAVAGSLAGVMVGNALGGTAGATISSLWGRLAGGVMGLGAYGAWAYHKHEASNPSPYDLTCGDKLFLAKIVGGAAAGAAVGTAAGVYGGRALGAIVANGMFGPGSSSWGATAGGWAGALLGSYALAKTGAVVGRHFLEKDNEPPPSNPS